MTSTKIAKKRTSLIFASFLINDTECSIHSIAYYGNTDCFCLLTGCVTGVANGAGGDNSDHGELSAESRIGVNARG